MQIPRGTTTRETYDGAGPLRRVAVLGARGQLGSELCRQLGERAIPLSRRELDLVDLRSIAPRLYDLRPDAVINAAAYTHVDEAEVEFDVCRTVNALAVHQIAMACRRLDCPLVQVSTDYVFGKDATRCVPYVENDAPGPINIYGATKLEGEQFAAAYPRHLIVRTCGLYTVPVAGSPHQNFVTTMLRLAAARSRLKVVNDQHCTPSFVPHVARAMLFLLSTGARGTYHVVQRGATSWFEFAREIFRALSTDVEVVPISSQELPTRARRPRYSVLAGTKYEALGGPVLPDWRAALGECLGSGMPPDVSQRTNGTKESEEEQRTSAIGATG